MNGAPARHRRAAARARAGRVSAKLGVRPRGSERLARDAVTLALYRGLFTACAEEMGATLMRAAESAACQWVNIC